MKKIYLFLFVVVVFVPLGLLTENPAWGEWEEAKYQQMLGYIPKGISNSLSIKSPFPDYSSGFLGEVGSYYLSAFIGISLIFIIFFLLKKVIKRER